VGCCPTRWKRFRKTGGCEQHYFPLCRFSQCSVSKVDRIRCLPIERRVWSACVEKSEVASNPDSGSSNGLVGMQVDLLVLHPPPKAFYGNVIYPTTFAIHADWDVVSLQNSGKVGARKLRARLIAIAMGRIYSPATNPREIASRSANDNERRERHRGGGEIPPVVARMHWIEE